MTAALFAVRVRCGLMMDRLVSFNGRNAASSCEVWLTPITRKYNGVAFASCKLGRMDPFGLHKKLT